MAGDQPANWNLSDLFKDCSEFRNFILRREEKRVGIEVAAQTRGARIFVQGEL